jgi:8-oxo-dGTP pyrophosphatase MutT (NUDIX family)
MPISDFTVAGALVETADGLLLVRNRRRNGSTDWSPPGGVIDANDASLLHGLAREVEEETGLVVTEWEGPLYEVRVRAVSLGWAMRCEVHRAVAFAGELVVDDPDGIVIDARFAGASECAEILASCHPWVAEPLGDWLATRWGPPDARAYAYEVHGTDRDAARTVRV